MDTGKGALHIGVYGGNGKGQWGRRWGGIAWKEMPNVSEGQEGSKTLPCVYLHNYFARSAHVSQNLKCNKKIKK